ncbi:hypothetical protein JCM11641_003272 [Rhodosporidiobolus odoratus]
MRSSVSFGLTSALLLSSPFASAFPTLPRRSSSAEAVPTVQPAATTQAPTTGGKQVALHRRGSAELMREDGSVDLNKAHAHLARARAKYVRGLENFQRNTGNALFLSPELVDPSLLPFEPSIETAGEDIARRAAWGTGEESSLEWEGEVSFAPSSSSASTPIARRSSVADAADKLFDAATKRKGVPPANKRALEKRVVKNPKVVWNPKAHSSSSTATSSAAGAAKTGGVGLTDCDDGTLWYGTISIGTPAVDYVIDFDTGSADLWIPSVNCTSAACNTHAKYDPSSSSTSASILNKKLSITYGDGSSTKGTVWSDTVSIAGLTATSQTFGAAYSLTSDFQDDPYDGLMGMAYGSISTMGASPLFQTLVSQSKVAASQFSFLLAESGSELFLGGMNAKLYEAASTHWYPVVSQSYWLLATQANVGDDVVSTLGTFNSIIDTGTSVIVAPTAAAATFWASVPNSGVYGGNYYTFLCADAPTISFSFGTSFGEKWAISGESLNLGRVSSGSDRCVGAIVGADIGLGSTWILGAAFLENVYSTFDISTNSVGFSDLA